MNSKCHFCQTACMPHVRLAVSQEFVSRRPRATPRPCERGADSGGGLGARSDGPEPTPALAHTETPIAAMATATLREPSVSVWREHGDS